MMVSIRVLKDRYPEDKGYCVVRNRWPNGSDIPTPMVYEDTFKASRSYVRVWDDVGGIIAEFKGYVPKRGGTVLYDDGEIDGYWLNRFKIIM